MQKKKKKNDKVKQADGKEIALIIKFIIPISIITTWIISQCTGYEISPFY